jgi:hypothetical protein
MAFETVLKDLRCWYGEQPEKARNYYLADRGLPQGYLLPVSKTSCLAGIFEQL